MSNITVKRNGGQLAPSTPEWDPFRFVRDFFGWDPFREMAPAWPVADRTMTFNPSFEVKETKDSYLFNADLPGIHEKDLDVTLTGNRLTVSGKRDAEKKEQHETLNRYSKHAGPPFPASWGQLQTR